MPMENNDSQRNLQPKRFAVIINLLAIVAIAIVGIFITYFSIALFTKHGEQTVVPRVESMSYTKAVETLHNNGFNVEIRDSVFRDDIKPGYVIEQFPRANSTVKPGRKIFLYINAVHPKEVVIDDEAAKGQLALKDWSLRQTKARLMELGFKKIAIVTVLGTDDRVVKLLADGRPIYKMQKVAVNVPITIEVSDGRLSELRDQLYDEERLREYNEVYGSSWDTGESSNESPNQGNTQENSDEPDYFEEPEYFQINDGGEF